jgi:hypothetical protein
MKMAISRPPREFIVMPVIAGTDEHGENAIPIRALSAPDQIASLRSQ